MKKKLIQEAKNDIRQEVYNLAQQEQMDREIRQKIMEDWMRQQHVDEAHMIARQTKGLSDREELERLIDREYSTVHQSRSFKQWVKKETLLEEKKRLLRLLERREQIMQR